MCFPGLEQMEVFFGHGLFPAALSTAFRAREGGISAHLQTLCHSLQLPLVCSHMHTSTITPFQEKKGGLKAGKGHEKLGEKEWAGKG